MDIRAPKRRKIKPSFGRAGISALERRVEETRSVMTGIRWAMQNGDGAMAVAAQHLQDYANNPWDLHDADEPGYAQDLLIGAMDVLNNKQSEKAVHYKEIVHDELMHGGTVRPLKEWAGVAKPSSPRQRGYLPRDEWEKWMKDGTYTPPSLKTKIQIKPETAVVKTKQQLVNETNARLWEKVRALESRVQGQNEQIETMREQMYGEAAEYEGGIQEQLPI